jgi:hypothetical protein
MAATDADDEATRTERMADRREKGNAVATPGDVAS